MTATNGHGARPKSAVLYAGGRSTPRPLEGDGAVIRFEGDGRARFRIQHTRDRAGRPDRFGWVDVSNLSNGEMEEDTAVDQRTNLVRGVIADVIEGDTMVVYRRHVAAWLRVLPFDHHDKANIVACRAFVVSMEE